MSPVMRGLVCQRKVAQPRGGNASDIPDRNKGDLLDFAPVGTYNLVKLSFGYQSTSDILAASGST